MIGFDYESYLISDKTPIPKPVCLSYFDDSSGKGEVLIGDNMASFLEDCMKKEKILIAQNCVFELMVTYNAYPHLRSLLWEHLDAGRFKCTQIYQQLLDNLEKSPKVANPSLANMVKYYFNKDISESKTDPMAWRLRYSELDGVALNKWPKEAYDYSLQDSIYCLDIYKKQRQLNSNLSLLEHLQASFALNLSATRGILTDKNRVETLEAEIDAILQPNYQKLESQGFMKRDKNNKLSKNVKTLKEYIQANFDTPPTTGKGAVKVDAEALDYYKVQKQDDIIDFFSNIGIYEKAKTAFLSHLKEANPIIRTSYNPIVRSGRTSSRASKAYPSVNIQQMPRGLKGVTWDIRNCFIPRPGYKLVTIDYNNLELLACADQLYKYYGKCAMRDIINGGTIPTDLHSVFACELMSSDTGKKVSYEEFMKHKKEEGYKEYRSKGKPVTLGVPGGMGYDTIRGQFFKEGIQLQYSEIAKFKYERTARKLMKQYEGEYPALRVKRTGFFEWSIVSDEIVNLKKILFRLYPELETFLKVDHVKFVNGETGYTRNEWGEWEKEPFYRYNVHGVRRDYCTYTALCNGYLMQGPSAVGAKQEVYDTVRYFENNDDVHLLAFIHDENVFEIRDNDYLQDNIDQCANIMIDSMQRVLKSVRVAVEAEVKPYWSKEICESSRVYWKDYNSKELRWK